MVTSFFCACHKSKITPRQLVHLMSGSFFYSNACQLVNTRIVERILLGRLTYWTRYKTRIDDWLAFKADTSSNVSFPYFAMAKLYYSLIQKLLEGDLPFLFHSFSGSCYYSPYGQIILVKLNYPVFQAAQRQNSRNRANSNQRPQSGDEINTATPNGLNT